MFGGSKKPYSAVTVQIDRLTSEQFEENDLGGIVDLVEVIRIQDTGPTEAARAIRKKLKYGNMHRQLRALTILDGLIQNAGARFQRTFADEPLLERLRLMPRDEMVDSDVRAKCNTLYRQWAVSYKKTPGLEKVATLYRQLPQTKRRQPSQSRVIRETEEEAHRDDHSSPPSSPPATSFAITTTTAVPSPNWTPQHPVALGSTTHSSFFKSKDKRKKSRSFNLEREKGQLLETIASASVASTNLLNAIRLINRENQRVSDSVECKNRFETCKVLRRQILRYIQLVESEQYIGSLLSANDELVKALMAYEVMDKSIDDDSDSDMEQQIANLSNKRLSGQRDVRESFIGLTFNEATPTSPPKPSKPTGLVIPPSIPTAGKQKAAPESEDEDDNGFDDDEDNPFADSNAVKTPFTEETVTWRDV